MSRILLTAFEPYEPWTSNASWLAIVELTRSLQVEHDVTTRLYPVELSKMKQRLETDLKARYDFAIHLGQAPGSSCISLEKFAVNAVHDAPTCAAKEAAGPICSNGPASFAVSLPIREMAAELRQAGIPARVSFGGGAYLCNATLYWSSHLARLYDLETKSMFIHLPLETSQVLELDEPRPFMPASMSAAAISQIFRLLSADSADVVPASQVAKANRPDK